MEVLSTPTLHAAAIDAAHPLASILARRTDIFEMTEKAEHAAIAPRNPGGLSHGERAALACRVARINAEPALAAHFEKRLAATLQGPSAIVDPTFDGGTDTRMAAIVRHTDRVTRNPKAVSAADIDALTDAGISEDDIVRLSQLVAFVNYQARVSRGVRLMAEAS